MTGFDPRAVLHLEEALGHTFRDRALLRTALTHPSFAAESPGGEDYERLEFLGDAVLQLAVTHHLYETRPDMSEGQMAKVRAAVVSRPALAGIARDLGIPDAVLLGRGEETTGGREKDSILADVVEALLGALFLEAGYEETEAVILDRWEALVDERAATPGQRDYKTRLQELLAQRRVLPEYRVEVTGPDHARVYEAVVEVEGRELGRGMGTSKKRAEQEAARLALETLAHPDA